VVGTRLVFLTLFFCYRRFIWAEVSFLSKWWEDATPEKRKELKALVQNGQLGNRRLGDER